MLRDNIDFFKSVVEKPNPFGEKIVLCGASKMQSAETINEAIRSGLTDVGENKAQEFRDKYPLLLPVNYHFFGKLQKNKVKYLIGKVSLIQSVDSPELAEEISVQSVRNNTETKILLEVNDGEEQKGGLPFDEVENAYLKIRNLSGVTVCGLMCVLPDADSSIIRKICLEIRGLFDKIKKNDEKFTVLSMGMTKDYKIAIECGSNMIRIGTGIFGKRNY